jgi:hypothetical protein
MKYGDDDIYDVSKYSDPELYQIVGLPETVSDKELEVTLWKHIHKYQQVRNPTGAMLAQFFYDMYKRWFEVSDDDDDESYEDQDEDDFPMREGFTTTQQDGQNSGWSKIANANDMGNGQYTYNPNTNPKFGSLSVNGNVSAYGQTNQPNIQYANVGRSSNAAASYDDNIVYEDTANLTRDIGGDTAPSTKNMGYQANAPATPNDVSITKQVDYSKDNLNPLLKQTIKRIISIDSQYRHNKQSSSTNFTFNLSEPLRDVVSLKLYSIQIPFTWYTVNGSFGGNFFYIKGNTAGIDNGNHDYKIEIRSGNYGPSDLIDAINVSIHTLENTVTDVSFGQTQLIYNASQATCTMNIDITDVYNQSFYSVDFPNWTTNPTKSLASYLGYTRNAVDQTPLSVLSTAVYSGVTSPSQTATITSDNSSVMFVSYRGTSYAKRKNTEHTYTITLDIDTTGTDNIMANLNAKMTASNYFDMLHTNISYVPIDSLTGYYQFKIKFDKRTTYNDVSLNYAIVFPSNMTSTANIWYDVSSAFYFSDQINECNNLITTQPFVSSTFYIDRDKDTQIRFQCQRPGYDNGSNDYIIDISNGTNKFPVGYSLPGFIQYINEQIAYVSKTQSLFPDSDDLRTNVMTSGGTAMQYTHLYTNTDTHSVDMDIEIMRIFKNQNYYATCPLFDASHNGLYYMVPSGGFVTPAPYPTGNWIDLSNTNVFTLNIPFSTQAANLNLDGKEFILLPKLLPNPNLSRNTMISIPLQNSADVTQAISVINGVYNSIQQYMDNTHRICYETVLGPRMVSTYTGDIQYTDDTDKIYYTATLTVNINVPLTQKDYNLIFIDPVSNPYPVFPNADPSRNFWCSKLHMDRVYDLSKNQSNNESGKPQTSGFTYDHTNIYTSNLPIYKTTITNLSDVSDNRITMDTSNNYFYLDSYSTDGLLGSDAESIAIQLPTTTQDIGSIMTSIQTQLTMNPYTVGSTIQYTVLDPTVTFNDALYHTRDPLYITLRLNINKVYRTGDYRMVFYDPYSFVSCYSGASHVGSRAIQNVTWDTTVGWLLGFRNSIEYDLSPENPQYSNVTTMTSDTCISTNLYNYFLIMLDDYTQNHLNDGLVTITMQQTDIDVPLDTQYVCNPITGTMVVNGQQNMTQAQVYADNQKMASKNAKLKAAQKSYSNGPFVKDIFGLIPMKTSGFTPGSVYVEFGGTLQNQERTYFGPVNIHRMTIQLLTDRGDLVDLNNANWSFSFVCETLYKSKTK